MASNSPDLRDPRCAEALLRDAAEALRTSATRAGSAVRLPASGSLVVAGDLHDNPIHLRRLLRLARLDHGADRHLVLHELIHGERLVDGADLSHRVLLRVADLVLRRPGQVHPILANHEIAQLTRRGVSKGAGDSVVLFEDGLAMAYHGEWERVAAAVDEFIRAMPLALRSEPDPSDRTLLCAHSLPAPQALRFFDAAVLERHLVEEDYLAPSGAAYLMTWGRGLDPDHLASLGERWGVSLFCLGHQWVEGGAEFLPPNAVVLNSDHARGAALRVALDRIPQAESAAMEALHLAAVPDEDGPWL